MAAESTALHQFGNILLGGRGGMNPGQLKIHPGGFVWRKTGGGKVVDVSKADISSLSWTRLPKGYQLGVKMRAGSNVKFSGFREQDVASLNPFLNTNMGITPEDKPLAISGRNWGDTTLEGNMLSFVVGGKQAFEVSITDVSQTQMMGKNDVVLEFHVDDTTGANEDNNHMNYPESLFLRPSAYVMSSTVLGAVVLHKVIERAIYRVPYEKNLHWPRGQKDTLMELSFHVPSTNTTYIGDEERPSAQVFREKILSMADVGPSGEEAIAMFVEVGILTPRGRYNVELHMSFLRLQGQANDFKIQYNSVVRLFILPKSNQPHTFVVITLDPPIRKGQTFYPHIVLQFPSEEITECSLSIQEDLLNTKYKDRLQPHYKDLSHDVFTQILKGLSGAKVTRPGKFRSSQDGYAVRASLKAEEGTLYPLEKSFFFLPKPPTLILHDEIEYVEFERHGTAGPSSISSHYFDILIRLKSEQEHQFRNIQRNEYHNLFDFISSKGLKILNLSENAQAASGVAAALAGSDDEGVDPHLNRIRNARGVGDTGGEDSDEEDEDFVAEKDDEGSPTDDSEGEEPDGSDDGGGGDEDEEDDDEDEDEEDERPARKEKKKREPAAAKQSRKRKSKDDAEGGKKSKRKKKDPNAPKRGLSGFMYFSQSERENLKKSQPGMSFTETGKFLGDKWKKMSGDEKAPFEEKAKADKERYKRDMLEFNRGGAPQADDDASDEE